MAVPYDAGRCTVNAIFHRRKSWEVFPGFPSERGLWQESLARLRGEWQARLPWVHGGLYSKASAMSAADGVCDVDGASA